MINALTNMSLTKEKLWELVFPNMKASVELWWRFANTTTDQHVAIAYHGDLDGVLGAVCMRKVLLTKRATPSLYWIATEEYHFSLLADWLRNTQPAACAFSDVAIENSPAQLQNIAAAIPGNVFIYDHHRITSTAPLPANVVLANPTPSLRKGERHLPTFVLARVIADELGLAFPDWLLLLVIFAEGVDESYADVAASAAKSAFPGDPGPYDRLFFKRSGLQRISTLIRAGFSSREKTNDVASVMEQVLEGTLSDALEMRRRLEQTVGPTADQLSTVTSATIDQWEAKLRHMPAYVAIVPIEAELPIAGPVASVLRGKFPDRVIVAYQTRGEHTSVEIRTRNDTRLNLPDLLKEAGTRVPLINSGGHPSAAGVLLESQHLERFLSEFSDILTGSRL